MRRAALVPLMTITAPANFAAGHRLEHLDAVAVLEHEIQGDAVKPRGL